MDFESESEYESSESYETTYSTSEYESDESHDTTDGTSEDEEAESDTEVDEPEEEIRDNALVFQKFMEKHAENVQNFRENVIPKNEFERIMEKLRKNANKKPRTGPNRTEIFEAVQVLIFFLSPWNELNDQDKKNLFCTYLTYLDKRLIFKKISGLVIFFQDEFNEIYEDTVSVDEGSVEINCPETDSQEASQSVDDNSNNQDVVTEVGNDGYIFTHLRRQLFDKKATSAEFDEDYPPLRKVFGKKRFQQREDTSDLGSDLLDDNRYNFRERKKIKNIYLDAIDAINDNKVSLDEVNERLLQMSRKQDKELASLIQVMEEPGKGDGITAKVDLPQGESIGIYFGVLRKKKDVKDKEYAQEILDDEWVLDPKPWIENGYKPLPATLNTADDERDNNVDVSDLATIILRDVPSDKGEVNLRLEIYENRTKNKIKAGEFLNRSYGKDYIMGKKKITTACDKTVIEMCDGKFKQNKLPCVPVKQMFFSESNSYGPSVGDPITDKSDFDRFCAGLAKMKDEIEVSGSGYILLKKSYQD